MKNKVKPDPALSAHYRIINGVDEDIVRRCFWKEMKQQHPEEDLDIPALEKSWTISLLKACPSGRSVSQKKKSRRKNRRRPTK